MYKWETEMNLFPDIRKFNPTTFHELTNIWLVVSPHHMIPPLSMFQYGRELENFKMG